MTYALGFAVLGFAIFAWITGDAEAARHLVLVAMLFGISAQVSQLRDEIRDQRIRNAKTMREWQ